MSFMCESVCVQAHLEQGLDKCLIVRAGAMRQQVLVCQGARKVLKVFAALQVHLVQILAPEELLRRPEVCFLH